VSHRFASSLLAAALAAAPARASAEPEAGDAAGVDADAAVERRESRSDRRSGWVFLPGVTYTPDRGLTFAGGALRYFRSDEPDARTSRAVLTVEASVSGRGTVSFDPAVWLQGGRFHLGGTAWVSYLDYAYFGVGNDTRMEDREDYTAVRATVRPELVMRITRELYGGAVYEFRYENQVDVEKGGDLAAGRPSGAEGAVISGLGGLLRWDSRGHAFTPRSGGLVTLSPRLYRRELGGQYDFTRLLLEASWFFSLGGEHVLGVDGRVDLRGGEPPFTYLSGAGGSHLLRGMLEGRFRDRHFAGAQVEYRSPLWWRLGGAAFVGLGRVAGRLDEFRPSGLKYSVGGGVRFAIQEDERITIRLDYGRSADDSGFYLAMLEAF
jgi:outer membrane protein assembly factor BamA